VRPVLSSVSDILEVTLSRPLLHALSHGKRKISIDYDPSRHILRTSVGKETFEAPYVGRLDSVRVQHSPDLVANIAIHEAGHAVAYMRLFGVAPLQITARVASVAAPSFMFPHEIIDTRGSMLDRVRVYLAGGLAEELAFGEANASTGRGHDREVATQIIADHVRRYGFDPQFQASYTMEGQYHLDRKPSDAAIEAQMRRLADETRALLAKDEKMLRELARRLQSAGALGADAAAECAAKFGLVVRIEPEGARIAPSYAGMMGKG
jgi:hypothetical protein